jgi:hypothetical protein
MAAYQRTMVNGQMQVDRWPQESSGSRDRSPPRSRSSRATAGGRWPRAGPACQTGDQSKHRQKHRLSAGSGPDATGRNAPAPPANAHPITARQAPPAPAKFRPFRRSTTIPGLRFEQHHAPDHLAPRDGPVRWSESWAPMVGCASAILAACTSRILTRPGTTWHRGVGHGAGAPVLPPGVHRPGGRCICGANCGRESAGATEQRGALKHYAR